MKKILPFGLFFLILLCCTDLIAQCDGCPTNDNGCTGPECCIAEVSGNSITQCISGAATQIRVKDPATISSGDISGIQFCLDNNTIDIAESVIIDNATCFSANGSHGVSVTIGGTTFDFSDNDNTLDELNAAIANLSGTSTIGSAIQSLPVELKRFQAKFAGSEIHLNWATSMESDNDFFAIEHSTDGRNFQLLDKIPSQGNTATGHSYQYEHRPSIAGTHYYRLSQYDLDGSMTYLGIKEIKQTATADLQVYPNPVTRGGWINISTVDQIDPILILTNLLGKQWRIIATTSTGSILPTDLPTGTYILTLEQAPEIQQLLIVQ